MLFIYEPLANTHAQSLASNSPAKEFVYSGGRLVAVVSSDNSATALPGSPVANIPFSSFAGGQAVDASGNGNHLTLGLTTAAETEDPTPLSGKGVEFNSSENDQLTFGAPNVGGVNFFPNSTSSFSVAIVVKRGQWWPPAFQRLLDAGHLDLHLHGADSDAHVRGVIRGAGLDSGTFTTTDPVIYVARWNGSNLKTRINDGQEYTRAAGTGSQQSVDILIGRKNGGSSTSLSTGSKLYHVVIWNGALSDTEMTEAFLHLCGQLQGAGVTPPSACP